MAAQKEIAQALGVSVMTVSRALRNHPDMAAATREQILRKAAELGYLGTGGRNGVSAPTRIGILAYERDKHSFHWNTGVARQIFAAIQKECKRHGVETLVESVLPGEIPLSVKNRTVDRAFIFGRYTPEAIGHLGKMSCLAVSSYIACESLPRIVADNEGGIIAVTEHLIRLGHRKILFFGLEESSTTELYRAREAGYVTAMHRHGLPPRVRLSENVESEIAPLMEDISEATAVVCATDNQALLLDRHLRKLGWDLPKQCSITGFDNADSESGQLTTYAPNWELMGKLSVELLLLSVESLAAESVRIVVPGKLIERDSTLAI
jgi:LacI family transcriptional regulator